MIQNRAASIIMGPDQCRPSAPLFETLSWKTVKELVLYGHDIAIAVYRTKESSTLGI